MKQYFVLSTIFCFLIFCSSCRKNFEFQPSAGDLQFSKDTIYLDTIFTNISSNTYNLKVYNKSNNDIVIPTVKLGKGYGSNYRMNIDGLQGVGDGVNKPFGKVFENVEILAKDSLYIFIETTILNNNASAGREFLDTDVIEFDSGTNQQKVDLVTLVKDAVFIYPNRNNTTNVVETLTLNSGGKDIKLQGRELLPTELTFTNEKAYVIYGYAAVPMNQTLTIEAGARVYFHSDSGIIVSNGASLKVNGALSTDKEALENEVIFEGDRLESSFSDTPGQWGTIRFLEGSVNNTINYATIKNALAGIICEGNPDDPNNKLTITNSQIYNSSHFGILGKNTSIDAKNIVINNSGLSSFAGTIGGKYNFTHCTIANYWNNGFRKAQSLSLNNFVKDEKENITSANLVEANFNNCIIYGNENNEISLNNVDDNTIGFNFKFTNCLIKFSGNSDTFKGPNYDLNNTSLYESNLFNKTPDFKDPKMNMLNIGDKSEAINKGQTSFTSQMPTDLLNVDRTIAPDLGAYQHVMFPEDK